MYPKYVFSELYEQVKPRNVRFHYFLRPTGRIVETILREISVDFACKGTRRFRGDVSREITGGERERERERGNATFILERNANEAA